MTDTIEARLRDSTHALAATTVVSPDTWERITGAPQPRRRPRHGTLVAAAVVVALAIGLGVFASTGGFGTETHEVVVSGRPSLPPLPTGATSAAGWASIPKEAAGIEAGASLDSIASDGRVVLVAGGRGTGDPPWSTAIWRSTDGVHWQATDLPSNAGIVSAIALHGDEALAVAADGNGVSTSTWRSLDAGRTWKLRASDEQLFGPLSDLAGRPFVEGLVRRDGRWVASGGGGEGYTGIWISRDGARWRQTLSSSEGSSGTVKVIDGGRNRLLAYGAGEVRWTTDDPSHWKAKPVSKPKQYFLSSIARGARVALGELWARHGQPTPLLRSDDGGRTWKVDHSFLEQYPDAWGWTITHARGLWIVAGASGVSNHPDAWVSPDLRTWTPMPAKLFGPPGGTLSLVGRIGTTTVLFGTAPELDRFYAFDTRAVTPRT